jgi:hypothetical protein
VSTSAWLEAGTRENPTMTRTLVLAIGAALLASAAHADSIKGQENAEIAYCMVETNTLSGQITKDVTARRQACLKEHGWLPNSGTPDILPPAYIESANAAFVVISMRPDLQPAKKDLVRKLLESCRAEVKLRVKALAHAESLLSPCCRREREAQRAPPPAAASTPSDDDRLRAAILLGSQMAIADAQMMLVRKAWNSTMPDLATLRQKLADARKEV